jgi:uncharacterized protein (TIGR03084 family)
MDQAQDFRRECDALNRLLAPLAETDFARATGFKGWTINQILRHLHVWNYAADLSLTDEEAFKSWFKDASGPISSGGMPAFEEAWLEGLSGTALLATWRDFYPVLSDHFSDVDPSKRVAWAGPSMSARSSITARLMESWAHAQAIYDELGVVRENADHIRNIAVLGFNTYGWTFANRKLPVPEPRPQLVLTAPSGAIWTFGEEASDERIEGLAEQFCQVVTQTRNIADTGLMVSGPNANRWMSFAQCFAGPPNDPPEPGERCIRTV